MITLAELKAHLRIEHDLEDAYIQALGDAAIAKIENDTEHEIIAKAVEYRASQFTTPIVLPKYPVIDITSIDYKDSANADQSVAFHQLVGNGLSYELYPYFDESWPQSNGRPDSVVVTYQVGMAAMPLPLKQAALLLVGHWYANREAVAIGTITSTVPMAYESLIQPYRRIAL